MFAGGIYHGVLLLPKEFPFKAPHIQLLNPNGRFELRTNICIDGYTAWHENSWSATKNIAIIIRAVRSIFSDLEQRGIGYRCAPVKSEVIKLKQGSVDWVCKECGMNHSGMFGGKSDAETDAGSQDA